MLRFALLLLFIFLLFGGLLRMLAGPRRRGASHAAPRVPRMVRCAHCELYLPEDEALGSGEQRYCSAEHQALGPRSGT